MALVNEHIHIHIDNGTTNLLLQQILEQLKKCCPDQSSEDVIPQETIDKLDTIIADIKSTV